MIWERSTFAVIQHAGCFWLCLKYESTLTDRPVIITHYWPFQTVSPWDLKEGTLAGIEGAPAHRCDVALYSWRQSDVWRHVGFRLVDGGKTLPIKTTETPLPAPKVRRGIETRYYMGWWQKYTQRYGWENIPVPPL